jgi:hypothetical protein
MRAEDAPDRIRGSVDAVGRNAVERRQPDGGVMLWTLVALATARPFAFI